MANLPADPTPGGGAAHDRLAFEALIADTSAMLLLAATGDVSGAVQTAVERVRAFFQVGRCALLTVNEDRRFVTIYAVSAAAGVPEVSGEVNLAELFPWTYVRLVKQAQPVITVTSELPADAAVDRASNEAMGIRTALAVPVSSGGHVTHVIVLNAVDDFREWPLEYVPRLRLLAEMMISALQRHDAFEALRTSEANLRESAARLSAALDTAELGFSERTLVDEAVYLDARIKDQLGIDEPGQRPDVTWLSRIDPADRPRAAEASQRLRAGESERETIEYRYQHPRRGWIWLRHSARRAAEESGGSPKDARIFSAIQDITERREQEEQLKAAHEEVKKLRDRLERENVYLRKEVTPAQDRDVIAGSSPAILHALAMAEQVATTQSTVLLVGETGTGKERFAAHIHECSSRHANHMVRVNCSAIPSALIESELFGREKGAYTGALSKQIGRFELAHRSTLFLDEIGDLPLDVQVKLLRVIQERTIERLGSPTPVTVDVRIIAATNRDLEAAVRQGAFRSDLYYRLNVFPIVVPPLRDRTGDIPGLVERLVAELSAVMRKQFTAVDRGSLKALQQYDWPGNVRELRNILERAMILCPGPTLVVAPPRAASSAPPAALVKVDRHDAGTLNQSSRELHGVEREHILRVLETTGWRIRGKNAAAEILGLKATTLEAKMAKFGIRRPGSQHDSN